MVCVTLTVKEPITGCETEGEKRDIKYCLDGVTPYSWEECINGEWTPQSQTCIECPEGYYWELGKCVPKPEISWEWIAGIGIGVAVIGTGIYIISKKKKRRK